MPYVGTISGPSGKATLALAPWGGFRTLIAISTTINRMAIITTINRIAIITTIKRIAIITTINRIAAFLWGTRGDRHQGHQGPRVDFRACPTEARHAARPPVFFLSLLISCFLFLFSFFRFKPAINFQTALST